MGALQGKDIKGRRPEDEKLPLGRSFAYGLQQIDAEPEHYEQLGAFYEAKRDRFREQLLTTRLRPLPVPGGYFRLVNHSAGRDLEVPAFCRWLTVEHGVVAIPLSPFYGTPPAGQRLARLCFAKNESTLDAAIERLRTL